MLSNPKYFIFLFLGLLFVVAGHGIKVYFFDRNFEIDTTLPCDPTLHSCFVSTCGEEETCDIGPYYKIKLKASDTPICLEERSCPQFTCNNKSGCEEIFCSELNKQEGEGCLLKTN